MCCFKPIEYPLQHPTSEPMLIKWVLSTTEELLVLLGLLRTVRLERNLKFKDKSWAETGKG